MAVKNAKSLPEVYYGLHMVEGCAEYAEPGVKPYRIYIGETAIKNMNPTFRGKPVYVDHVDEVDLPNLEKEMDGIVVRSFFNKADGKNWAEFVVFTDQAKEAIRNGWTLSNAYVPKGFAGGGENHAVQYDKEVTSAEYEHLAIVQNPRYEESVILTPEQFKEYNEGKEAELTRLANNKTKEKEKMGLKLNLFKKKVENQKDLDLTGVMVELPQSKKEMLLTDVIVEHDKIVNMNGYASDDHMVKCNDQEEMSVKELRDSYNEMKASKENETEEEGVEEGLDDEGDRGGDESLDNEEDVESEEEGMENESEDDKPKASAFSNKDPKKNGTKKNSAPKPGSAAAKAAAAKLKNAKPRVDNSFEAPVIDLGPDKIARGKSLFGSDV